MLINIKVLQYLFVFVLVVC